MSPYEIAHQLAQALCESVDYRDFLVIKEKVKADEGNFNMIKDFQIKQWEIQQTQMLQQEVSSEKKQELERLYSMISLNASAREYLEAEFSISRLVNDIQKIIGDAIKEALPIGFEELDS